MDIQVPRFQRSEVALLDAFHMTLDATGGLAFSPLVTQFDVGDDESGQQKLVGPNRVDEAKRTVSGTANALEISRTRLHLQISGLDVADFNALNPVVLAAHEQFNSSLAPAAIAMVERVFKCEGNERLRFKNMQFDTDPLAEQWFQKVLKGYVRMVSVGFVPIDYGFAVETVGTGPNKRERGYVEMAKAELTEISVCAVGANRGSYFGQVAALSLLQRAQDAEQHAAALHQAVEAWLKSEGQTAAIEARSQLLRAVKRYS